MASPPNRLTLALAASLAVPTVCAAQTRSDTPAQPPATSPGSPALPANRPIPPNPATSSGSNNPIQSAGASPFAVPTPNGPITVQRFRKADYDFASGDLHAEGGVEILFTSDRSGEPLVISAETVDYNADAQSLRAQGGVAATYNDPGTRRPTTLTADSLEYDPETGVLTAQGKLRIERSEGVFTGDSLTYNFNSRSGAIINGNLVGDNVRLLGKRIETIYDGKVTRYTVENAVFTTCIENRPDYQLHARHLTFIPNRYVSARSVTFYAGRAGLFTLPSYRRDLRVGNTGSSPLPTPGYNRSEGLTLRFRDSPLSSAHRIVDYDARLSFKNFPVGFVSYQQDVGALVPLRPNVSAPTGLLDTLGDPLRGFLEQLTSPTYQDYNTNRYATDYERRATAFAILQRQQYTYNRRNSNVSISRFPEVGIRFNNVLGRSPAPAPTGPLPASGANDGTGQTAPGRSAVAPVAQRIPNAPFLINLTASLAALDEQPTRVTALRAGGRAEFATQPLVLARRLSLRGGATDLLSFYSRGSIYNLFMPEVALNYTPTSTSVIGVGYRFLTDVGRTPFEFDRRDLRHELRFQYQVGGPWAFGIGSRIDLERSRSYDSNVAVVRNFDCMQAGFSYSIRSRSLNIILNILPPLQNRARRFPLGSQIP